MSQWTSIDDELPEFGREVLIKCKGWKPTLATYISNPHCQFRQDDISCCGIWMTFDYKNQGRVVAAKIQAWCEVPEVPKNLK